MKRTIEAIKNFSSTALGNVVVPVQGKAPTFTLEDTQARKFVEAGLCKYVDGAAKPQAHGGDGLEKLSAASPADPASHKSNATTSAGSAELSPSTTTTSAPHGPTPSTPQTAPGGKSTAKKSHKTRSGSRPTTGPHSNSAPIK